ncbi:Hsp70 family protein [Glycomyces tarimensis]
MHSVSRTVGIGVDLGSSATTVSTRRSDDRPETRHFDRTATKRPADDDGDFASVDALAEAIGGVRGERPDGLAAVALAIPATWNSTRRRAHAEAAANAGFDGAVLVPEPEAAARYLAEVRGRELEPGTSLVVYSLGADSCNVGIVRRDGDRYTVEAAKCADGVGGREFDRLLLDHLESRHRATDPAFWNRARDPAETALRASLLEEVRRAREHLTDHPTVAISLPGRARDLRLTREEAEQCLTPAVLQTVALVEDAMRDAGVAADEVDGLLLVGGASRTPLITTIVRFHLGIEPVLPEMPELVLAEGSALAALAQSQGDAGDGPSSTAGRPARMQPSIGVMAVTLVLFIALTAALGMVLINRDTPGSEGLGTDAVTDDLGLPSNPGASEEASPSASDVSASESSEPTEADESPGPQREAGGDDGAASEAPNSTEPADDPQADRSPTPVSGTPTGDATTTAATATATVPNVVGASVSEARQTLADAGFTNVVAESERRTQQGPEYDNCEVTAQHPNGGARKAHGDRITVEYVFVGTDTC